MNTTADVSYLTVATLMDLLKQINCRLRNDETGGYVMESIETGQELLVGTTIEALFLAVKDHSEYSTK